MHLQVTHTHQVKTKRSSQKCSTSKKKERIKKMGICFARSKQLVHPSEEIQEKVDHLLARRKPVVHPSEPYNPSPAPSDPSHSSGDILRIKIRMTAAEFKDLVSQVELGQGDSEIVRFITQECLQGTGRARVISRLESNVGQSEVTRLESISEEE